MNPRKLEARSIPENASKQEAAKVVGKETGDFKVEKKEPSLDEIISRERAETGEKIDEFIKFVERGFTEYQITEYFDGLENFVDKAYSSLENPEGDKTAWEKFNKSILALSKRMNKEFEPVLREYIEAELEDEESELSKAREKWLIGEGVARVARKQAKVAEIIDLKGSLKILNIHRDIRGRLEKVESGVKTLINTTELDLDAIFQKLLLSFAVEMSVRENDRKPTFMEKIIGKKKAKPDEQYLKLMDGMDLEYASKQAAPGISNRLRFSSIDVSKKINALIKNRRKRLSEEKEDVGSENGEEHIEDIVKILDEIAGELDGYDLGKPQAVKIKNQDAFSDGSMGRDFVLATEALSPVLGRKRLVKNVQLHAEVSAVNEGYVGTFNYSTSELELYQINRLSSGDLARTLAHETGHAMQLEKSLPLRDSITFGMELNASVMKGGFVSNYSRSAKASYINTFSKTGLSAGFMGSEDMGFVSDSNMIEEWAEMVAFSLVESSLNVVSPEKLYVVKKYMEKFDMDFEEVKKKMTTASQGGFNMQAQLEDLMRIATSKAPENTVIAKMQELSLA